MRTKKEYIQAICDTVPFRVTKKQIAAILNAQTLLVSNVLTTGPVADRRISIPGIARLRSVMTPAKLARSVINPATGDRMVVPAKPSSVKIKIWLLSKITGKERKRQPPKVKPPHRPTRFEREPVI